MKHAFIFVLSISSGFTASDPLTAVPDSGRPRTTGTAVEQAFITSPSTVTPHESIEVFKGELKDCADLLMKTSENLFREQTLNLSLRRQIHTLETEVGELKTKAIKTSDSAAATPPPPEGKDPKKRACCFC